MTRYGRLTVIKIERTASAEQSRKTRPIAICLCDCGNTVTRTVKALKAGKTQSCGCAKYERKPEDLMLVKRKKMLAYAKSRAKKKGIPFNICLDDIIIPKNCPLLGIPLSLTNKTFADDSPSLDRLIPDLGYVKGNIIVVSVRANTIKNNATIDELMLLTERLHAIFVEGMYPKLI